LSFAAHSSAIYALEFVPTAGGSIALVSGGDTEIRGWNWSALLVRIEGENDNNTMTAPARITPLFELIPTQHKGTRYAHVMSAHPRSFLVISHLTHV
jgi:hypothetical protein